MSDNDVAGRLRSALGRTVALRRSCAAQREAVAGAVDAESARVRARMDVLRPRAMAGKGAAYLARAEQAVTLASAARVLGGKKS